MLVSRLQRESVHGERSVERFAIGAWHWQIGETREWNDGMMEGREIGRVKGWEAGRLEG